MLNVERLMGWICLAMSMALVFPNGSRIYQYLHDANITVPCLLYMFAIGTGMIYASVTNYLKLRVGLVASHTALWIFLFAVLYDNDLGYGPLAAISIVMIVHSIIKITNLTYAINHNDKSRLR